MLVNDACERFLAHLDDQIQTGERKPKTRVFYFWQFKPLIREAGTRELETLTPHDLAACPVTNAFRRAVRCLFNFHDIKPPKWLSVPRCGQRYRILAPWEYRRLRRNSVGQVRWMVALIRHTGMRPQEVRELEWDRVHEERRVIELRTFKSQDMRQDALPVRWVPLGRKAARLFAIARAVCRPHPEQLVFANRFGRAWTCQAFLLAVRRAVERAGLRRGRGEQITAYTLRHTFATAFLRGRKGKKGGDVIMLAAIMGHSQIDTTRRYCHPTEDDCVAARDWALG